MEIKEIRQATGLTQRAFAEKFNIPLSTLRKWEQGISSCPQYVIELIAYRVGKEREEKRL